MRILLDTNVVSEIRRADANSLVVRRVQEIKPENTYLSVITVGELVYGLKRMAAGKKRQELEAWALSLQQSYAARLLPIDLETAQIWGEITAASESQGRRLSAQDGLLAATALRHGLHLMTRNVKDFAATGAMVINPWEA